MRRFIYNVNDVNGNSAYSGIISAENQRLAREQLIKSHNVDLTKCKVIVSSERLFDFEDNQLMWNTFFNSSMEEWDRENRVKLESTMWTDEQKIREIKKLHAYKILFYNATPYKISFIKKKQSLQQYKPIILQFEEYVGKSFNEVNAKDVEKFSAFTEKKNKLNHLNGFLLYCVSNGVLKNRDKEFLISLLPKTYRELGRIIGGLE